MNAVRIAGVCFVIVFVAIPATLWFSLSEPINRLRAFLPSASSGSNVVSYSQLPPSFPKALLAAENHRLLALQLARAMTTPGKQLKREMMELLLAERIRLQFSETEIMTMYANSVYLGRGITGVGGACDSYFGKSCSKLDLSESALLAALVIRPNQYASHIELGIARRNEVLETMRQRGIISSEDAAAAEAESVNFKEK